MPSNGVFRNEIRAVNASNFVQSLRTDNSGTGDTLQDNHLYGMIGREDDPAGTDQAAYYGEGSAFAAADGEWPDEENPPVPTSTPNDMKDAWSMCIGMQKVTPADITLMVPRRTWTTATAYSSYFLDVGTEDDSTWYTDNFYVITDLNEVWVCVVKGGGNSTDKPIRSGGLAADNTYFKDGKTSIYVSGVDGYSWKYLYTLTSYQINNLLETLWFPVPIGDSLWTPSGDPERTQGRDDSWAILNSRHVMIRHFIDAGADGSGKLPAGLRYRQVAFLFNPLLVTAPYNRATGSVYYMRNSINGTTGPDDELKKYSGTMIYLENRSPIARETNQAEEYRTILTF